MGKKKTVLWCHVEREITISI